MVTTLLALLGVLLLCGQSYGYIMSLPPPICILKVARDSQNLIGSSTPLQPPPNSPSGHRFTSPASLQLVHRLRRSCSHVLVGVGTVLSDDPTLNVRVPDLPPSFAQPCRVVIDPSLRMLATEHREKKFNVLYPEEPGDASEPNRGPVGPTIVYYRQYPVTLFETEEELKRGAAWFDNVKDRLFHYATTATPRQRSLVSFRELPARVPVPHFVLRDLNALHVGRPSERSGQERATVLVEGGAATAEHFLNSGKVTHAVIINCPRAVFGVNTTAAADELGAAVGEGGEEGKEEGGEEGKEEGGNAKENEKEREGDEKKKTNKRKKKDKKKRVQLPEGVVPSRLAKRTTTGGTFDNFPYSLLRFLGLREDEDKEGDVIECWSKTGLWPGEGGDFRQWP